MLYEVITRSLYVMIRTGKLFDSMPENILNRKLTQCGLM
ncbi:hypothetical protein LEP1GSC131_1797 [Leptospira kirschneri str. 200802841]|uniref:Uncharacterized protein n=1 Tax=Leptospira kirschneri str. 200802841 TaxID=1193047 RepID=A0A828XWI2_9LEPT|nr:hypothetical protein LEP1GSC131_1797 [Leptospira kirschneri str. 200802841]